MRSQIVLQVDRSSPEEKVRDFMDRFDGIQKKLKFQEEVLLEWE
jgi:hypothetical protein